LVLSCTAFAEKPFVDLSYPDAIKEAKSSGKLVMIDFYTTWCGPCKKLDKTTWKDEKVQAWLEENTIPLKVNAEKLRPVAKKFDVAAYPTIVFVDGDKKVVGRFIGYKAPDEFIAAAENAIAGITEASLARKELAKDENNPMLRNKLARELVREKKYEEALEHYVWCWEHGLDNNQVFTGVRVSFMLGDIQRLAKKYPPALEKMKAWRDKARKNFDSVEAIFSNCTDYFSLLSYMETSDKELLAIYDGLSERGEKGREIQSWVGYHIKDELFAQERFEEYLVMENIDHFISLLAMNEYSNEKEEVFVQMSVDNVLQPLEALLTLKQDDDANKLLKAILEFDASDKTIGKLRSVTQRRDRTDYLEVIDESVENQRTANVSE